MSKQCRVVIVGNGMVGHHCVEQLIELQQHDVKIDITVLSAESRLAYDRVHLSEFFAGKSAQGLALTDEGTYDSWQVNYRTNAKVIDIDRENKSISTHVGESFCYDKLILATGSYPFVPPIPGGEQPHCLVYRTIEDLLAIEKSASTSEVGVVIGGGLLGLEAANALKQLGLKTHVVEFAPQLMAVQVDAGGGQVLREKIEALGVSVHTSKATSSISRGETCRYKLIFSDETVLETDMILFSAGIRPHDQLARDCLLTVGERGGVTINHHCQTSDPDIYAIGECALFNQMIYGLVAPGYSMAKTAAQHILALPDASQFSGADMSTKLKLMSVDVGSIGDAHAKTEGAQCYTYVNQPAGIYKKIVVSEDHQSLLGAVLIGDTNEYDTLLQYKLNDISLPESPETLILPMAENKPTLGADALPDTATICSCLNVTKGDITQAIDQGSCTVADVKSCTKASSGCGGCAALLKSVVDSELESRGVEVKKDICQHFAYSRRELFDIVKIEKIRSFDELLAKHGQGLGCEICKPTAGSILASVWNDYILANEHLALQDTNDNFLANMQKDGTYSVVPRIPGGEITPEKLIKIGEVAQQYKLYTKITGGQRIDLFGARVEQLPEIWKTLIEAGLETGHAYGKSVRTVKSCVGSTWCRFGVQDSVSMAIAIENRYKGIRAPHKLKFAVSGCTRECAEAQSKDIGIIATDKGWNLYVCGNGGMKPRHADLFATDLDDSTLIQYIDRILAFYIQTAERLQRTSVWLENLEGGLAYLQQVVIEDHIGVCQSLEQHMTEIIGKYQCEWTTTLKNPEALKRFKQFVNSDESDENIQFVTERDQIRPATAAEKSNQVIVVEVL
ncbi:nitrite reductase large subunit NirB [Thalassotalea hakodatensis]|uniref:nitrite reductase large subunit NirB n=1 Tax=Thalassotalea hakodatensis TaxID=3030492 RepID=UPI0025746960|nr:nitrite reductase large subunit NirB [Thalassotalea hakodatensis]